MTWTLDLLACVKNRKEGRGTEVPLAQRGPLIGIKGLFTGLCVLCVGLCSRPFGSAEITPLTIIRVDHRVGKRFNAIDRVALFQSESER